MRIQIIFYMIGQKLSTKKVRDIRGIEQVREAQSSRKKKDKAVSFLEDGSEKILELSAVERDKPNTKLVLRKAENHCLTNPTNKTFNEIDSFNKFNFSHWQKILDTLIDVQGCEK